MNHGAPPESTSSFSSRSGTRNASTSSSRFPYSSTASFRGARWKQNHLPATAYEKRPFASTTFVVAGKRERELLELGQSRHAYRTVIGTQLGGADLFPVGQGRRRPRRSARFCGSDFGTRHVTLRGTW